MVWKLPLRATSRLVATSFWVRPMDWARVRSTLTVELGIVEGLLDAHVGGAGDVADLVQHVLGESAVAVEVGADDLDVDGRGEAEVENLGDDVDGQHVEGDAGILAGQHGAQPFDVVGGGMVVLGELDLDVGVGGTDGRGGGVGEIEAGVGQADVVDDGDDFVWRESAARMVASMWSQRAAVSSMRVPVRART